MEPLMSERRGRKKEEERRAWTILKARKEECQWASVPHNQQRREVGKAGRAGTPVPRDSLEAPGKAGPSLSKAEAHWFLDRARQHVLLSRRCPAHGTAAWWGWGSSGLTPLCSSWLFLACSIWELSATLVNFSSSTLCR